MTWLEAHFDSQVCFPDKMKLTAENKVVDWSWLCRWNHLLNPLSVFVPALTAAALFNCVEIKSLSWLHSFFLYPPAEQQDAGAAEWKTTWYMFWLIRLLNVGGSLISPSVSAARDREIRCLMSVYFYTTFPKKRQKILLPVFSISGQVTIPPDCVVSGWTHPVLCCPFLLSCFKLLSWMLLSKPVSHFKPYISAIFVLEIGKLSQNVRQI